MGRVEGGEAWEDQGHAHAPVCALSVLCTFCGYGAASRGDEMCGPIVCLFREKKLVNFG
jgi:hypothetical protein